jgi:hypothetical protein
MKYLRHINESKSFMESIDEMVKTITEILYELDDEGCRTRCKFNFGRISVSVLYRKNSNLPSYRKNETILRIKDYMESSKWVVADECNYTSVYAGEYEYDETAYSITFEPYKYYIYNPKLHVYYNGVINHTIGDVVNKELNISKKMDYYQKTIEKAEEQIMIIKKIDKGPFKDNMIITNQKGKLIK